MGLHSWPYIIRAAVITLGALGYLTSCNQIAGSKSLSIAGPSSSTSSSTGYTIDPYGVYVDPSASTNGTGTYASPYNTWASVSFVAGHNYYQKAGTSYTGIITVTTQATLASPITIGSYLAGAKPIIVGSVDFNGAAHITLDGFTVGSGQYASVIIRSGADSITVQNCQLTNSALAGVSITNAAGGSHMIRNNVISGHAYYGISIFEVDSGAGTYSTITGNTISGNQSHGIEIKGSHFVVSSNTLTGNGYAVGGSSGIHVYNGGFSGDPFSTFGASNIIWYNSVSGTVEPSASDGNGIELDQMTHDNTVSYNFSFNNAGAGINLYDSYNNLIENNFTYGNTTNSSAHSVLTELLMTASAGQNSNYGNTITGNTFLATAATNLAIYVDARTAAQSMTMSGNTLANSASSTVWSFNSTTGSDATFNATKWAGNTNDTIKSGTVSGIGTLPAPSYWTSIFGSPLRLLGYTISWY